MSLFPSCSRAQSWTRAASQEFNEPSWWFKTKGDHPWQVETPVDHEETERVFQADLKRFQPQDIDEIDFSQNLFWANLSNPRPKLVRPRQLLHRYQRAMKYVSASKTGESAQVRIGPVRTGVRGHRTMTDVTVLAQDKRLQHDMWGRPKALSRSMRSSMAASSADRVAAVVR